MMNSAKQSIGQQKDWIASSQALLAMTAWLRGYELVREPVSTHHEGVELVAFRVPEIGRVKSAIAARTGRAFIGATERERDLVDTVDLGPVLGGQSDHHSVSNRHRLAVEGLGQPKTRAAIGRAPGNE